MVVNSKILVAGGSGFIGSNLINKLLTDSNEVISISKNKSNFFQKTDKFQHIITDLSKPITHNNFESLKGVEYIINCSGYIDHRNFSNGGREIFNSHLISLQNLTNIASNLKVKAFIQIGSSDEYGKIKSPIKESTRETPTTPYGLGKLASTHLLQQHFREGLLNTVIVRPFLVFGELQNKNRFLPYLIDNCIKNKRFKVTKGEQIRDYLYIKDFIDGIVKCLNNEKAYGEIINIASGKPISIKEVILMVNEIIAKGEPIFGGINYREGESMELYANIDKAKEILNWEPKYNFKSCLKKVINWYAENP